MTLPNGHDQYFTTIKTKYLTGVVSTASTSVATAGGAHAQYVEYSAGSHELQKRLPCTATLEIVDSAGTTYYIPLFVQGG